MLLHVCFSIFRFFLVQSSPRLRACNQLLYAAKEGLAFGKGTHYARYIARYLRGKTVFFANPSDAGSIRTKGPERV